MTIDAGHSIRPHDPFLDAAPTTWRTEMTALAKADYTADERAPEDCRGDGPVELTRDVKVVIADEAKNIVAGARRSAYGKPENNFARIAGFWTAYAMAKGWPVTFTAADVSPMMRLMKEARLCETPDHRDSFVDLVGYTLTGAEVNGVKP